MTTKKPPVIITAPIITGTDPEHLAPLLEMIESLKANGATAVAEVEAERLSPYFQKMGTYLTAAMERFQALDTAPELAKPEKLSDLFNQVAARTNNALISEVVILPSDAFQTATLGGEREHVQYSPTFEYGDKGIRFGFLQIYQRNKLNIVRSSVTIPTLELDARMMKTARDIVGHDGLKELLEKLSPVMNAVNHDPLHHFTLTTLVPIVASPINRGTSGYAIDQWSDLTSDYERWAHVMHENILMHDGGQGVNQYIAQNMQAYFDILQTLQEKTAADTGIPREDINQCVDYFSMVMAHTLTRLYPLTSDMMDVCLRRVMELDPAPEKVRSSPYIPEDHIKGVFREYALAGYNLKPWDRKTEETITLDQYKLVRYEQLIGISQEDCFNHPPATESYKAYIAAISQGRVEPLHERAFADELAVTMLSAVNKDMNEGIIQRTRAKIKSFIKQ
jgi:hypothetical protein